MQNFNMEVLILAVIPVLMAITVHEAAHGYAARYWGDKTAEQLGRLTLNPFAHIDLIGTVVVPLLMFVTVGFAFGWAKPVPVVSRNMRDVRLGMRTVSIAGPLSNLAMAFGWGLMMVVALHLPADFQYPLTKMSEYGILINAVFFALNMIPILPLDGGRFVDTFLPAGMSQQFQKIEPYGMWIVLILLATGVLNIVMGPVVAVVSGLATALARMFM